MPTHTREASDSPKSPTASLTNDPTGSEVITLVRSASLPTQGAARGRCRKIDVILPWHQCLRLLRIALAPCFIATSCGPGPHLVGLPSSAGQDMLPQISVQLVGYSTQPNPSCDAPATSGNAGNLKATSISTSKLVNIDNGTCLQVIVVATNGVLPATVGGVKTLNVAIAQNGASVYQVTGTSTPDNTNKVPDRLSVYQAEPGNRALELRAADAPITVTAIATNFTGGVATEIVTVIPVSKNQRGLEATEDVVLSRVGFTNHYSGTGPAAAVAGTGETIGWLGGNYGWIAFPILGHTAAECDDPTSPTQNTTVALQPGEYLYSLQPIYGSPEPPLPLTIDACGGFGAPASSITVHLTYKIE